jgi:hypothetical protein
MTYGSLSKAMIGLRNQSVQHLHIETWRNNEGVELILDSQS